MKRLYFCAILVVFSYSLYSKNNINIKGAIKNDTIIAYIEKNELTAKTVTVSGTAKFPTKTGYIRILLSNDHNFDVLVYETFPLLATDGLDNFKDAAIESVAISSILSLSKLRIEIKDAELNDLIVTFSDKKISDAELKKANIDKIALINDNLRKQNALWVAGETSVSRMSYEEKKGLFSGKVPDLQGFDLYLGGIFELQDNNEIGEEAYRSQKIFQSASSNNFVSSFDWRNRHGASNPNSPYYNNGGHGWVTSVKNQSPCGSCGVFAVIGTIESLVNLYYNQFLNKDLSEQDIVSCFPYGSCANYYGWMPANTIDHIITNGVCEESCFPYMGTDLPCSDKCSFPTENIKVSGRIDCGSTAFPRTEDAIKRNIIQYGPISGGIYNFSHAMPMIGYKEIKEGDTIYTSMVSYIIIPADDSRIGQTSWLFKNSWGTSWGNRGFGYILPQNISQIGWTHSLLYPVTSLNYTDADIVCEDRDGDGYFFWGIGNKPSTSPACVPDEPDGDDSNPNLGPMDEYGNCEVITPMVETITTSQTWNTNKTICRNLIIPSGVSLTITATATVLPHHIITIQNGGKLILSGGTIDDGYVIAQTGSELTISNNGKIVLGNYDNLDVQLGAVFNLNYGEVSLK